MDGRIQQILRRFGSRNPRVSGPTAHPQRLIVGLGNPGSEYRGTRHNAGFRVVEEFASRRHFRFGPARKQARVAVGHVGDLTVALLEPLTYMNVSGEAIAKALREYNLTPADLLVVYDDVDLPLGRLRVRTQGSAAGHKGVLSTIERLGTADFARLRVGIGRPDGGDVKDYVLSPFSRDEEATFAGVLDRAVSAIETFLSEGVDVAMNQFNKV
ncbi:MAG: aminoacyl-tRNA hydrolase [Anaerolineae bacterium]